MCKRRERGLFIFVTGVALRIALRLAFIRGAARCKCKGWCDIAVGRTRESFVCTSFRRESLRKGKCQELQEGKSSSLFISLFSSAFTDVCGNHSHFCGDVLSQIYDSFLIDWARKSDKDYLANCSCLWSAFLWKTLDKINIKISICDLYTQAHLT